MTKKVAKSIIFKEEDYWLFPIMLFNVIFGASAIYASVLMFRAPAIILFCIGLWFTSAKVRRSYSPSRARSHIAITLASSLLLALLLYELTN